MKRSFCKSLPLLVSSLSISLLAGCSYLPDISMPNLSMPDVTKLVKPYVIDVRQGNFVTQDMVSQLKLGMSKDQVRYILGTPLLTDIFHVDRWDYVYRFKPGKEEAQQRRIAVFFVDGKLAKVDGDVMAATSALDTSGGVQNRVLDIQPPAKPGDKPAEKPAEKQADKPADTAAKAGEKPADPAPAGSK